VVSVHRVDLTERERDLVVSALRFACKCGKTQMAGGGLDPAKGWAWWCCADAEHDIARLLRKIMGESDA
jgi:hypothetical protein